MAVRLANARTDRVDSDIQIIGHHDFGIGQLGAGVVQRRLADAALPCWQPLRGLKESNDVVHTQPVAQGHCASALLLLPRRWPQRHHAADELHAPWNLRTMHTPRAQAAVIVSLLGSPISRQHTRPARTRARRQGWPFSTQAWRAAHLTAGMPYLAQNMLRARNVGAL